MITHRYHTLAILLVVVFIINLIIVPVSLAAPIDEVREVLSKAYVEEVPPDTLNEASIDEILKKLGDPYTNYLTSEEYKKLKDSLSDNKSVTGIGVYFEPCPEGIVVLQVVPDSPAKEAGIQKGDIITHADNKPLTGLSTETSISIITGPENSTVDLTVLRDETKLNFTLQRKPITISSVNSEVIDNHIGYVKLDNFGTDTNSHLHQTFTSPEYSNVDHWIVDVRENPGGYLETVVDTAGFFIGSGTCLLVKDRYNNLRGVRARASDVLVEKPTLILVDESSASAAEILTATLKDSKSALVIGRQTFGKGSVQTMVALSDGGILKVTVNKFFSPQGTTINKVGVLPHLVIKQADPQLVALLLSGSASGSDKTGYLSLRINGTNYEVNLAQAISAEYKAAFTELLWALPPETIIMQGNKAEWNYTTLDELARHYQLGHNPRTFKDNTGKYKNELNQLASHLLLAGYQDGTFAPNRVITRAELAAMIMETSGINPQTAQIYFSDVPVNSWYAPAITTLKQAGIITGDGDNYYPEKAATREEVITMLTRTHKYLTNSLGISLITPSPATDLKQVSPWARESVNYAIKLRFISTNSLKQQYITRGETAAILANLLRQANII